MKTLTDVFEEFKKEAKNLSLYYDELTNAIKEAEEVLTETKLNEPFSFFAASDIYMSKKDIKGDLYIMWARDIRCNRFRLMAKIVNEDELELRPCMEMPLEIRDIISPFIEKFLLAFMTHIREKRILLSRCPEKEPDFDEDMMIDDALTEAKENGPIYEDEMPF